MRAGTDLTLSVVLSASLVVAGTAFAAPGDLDPNFGNNGSFIQAFGPASSNLRAEAVQPDGKIVAAGWSQQSASAPANADFQLLRLNANGTLDLGFGGGDGIVTTPISAGTEDDIANAVALGPGGTIYLAGQTNPPGADFRDIAIARYDSSGTLDNGFGGDGIVVLSQPNINTATAIQVQADGKPVIGGDGPFVSDSDWLVARFETDGDLDPTFNAAGATPGILTTSLTSSSDRPLALQILGDGRLLTAGAANANSTTADVALAQYTAAGRSTPLASAPGPARRHWRFRRRRPRTRLRSTRPAGPWSRASSSTSRAPRSRTSSSPASTPTGRRTPRSPATAPR